MDLLHLTGVYTFLSSLSSPVGSARGWRLSDMPYFANRYWPGCHGIGNQRWINNIWEGSSRCSKSPHEQAEKKPWKSGQKTKWYIAFKPSAYKGPGYSKACTSQKRRLRIKHQEARFQTHRSDCCSWLPCWGKSSTKPDPTVVFPYIPPMLPGGIWRAGCGDQQACVSGLPKPLSEERPQRVPAKTWCRMLKKLLVMLFKIYCAYKYTAVRLIKDTL